MLVEEYHESRRRRRQRQGPRAERDNKDKRSVRLSRRQRRLPNGARRGLLAQLTLATAAALLQSPDCGTAARGAARPLYVGVASNLLSQPAPVIGQLIWPIAASFQLCSLDVGQLWVNADYSEPQAIRHSIVKPILQRHLTLLEATITPKTWTKSIFSLNPVASSPKTRCDSLSGARNQIGENSRR